MIQYANGTADTVVACYSFVALLMSIPMIWCEEHLWNDSVLHTVHISSLVCYAQKDQIIPLPKTSIATEARDIILLENYPSLNYLRVLM
jgi:hypothetical protein